MALTTHYCTLFDETYAVKGLALAASMALNVQDYRLHILALDSTTFRLVCEWIEGADLLGHGWMEKHVTVTNLTDVMTDELRDTRRSRTWQEFCWTLASVWLKMNLLAVPEGERCIYLDADSYFFSDPKPVYAEIGDASIALVPHRIHPSRAELFIGNGTYNANFIYMRNNLTGRAFAEDWARRCIDWCFYRQEDGKFGDQGHLDELVKIHPVFDIQSRGLNLAPWNQGQYSYWVSELVGAPDWIEVWDRDPVGREVLRTDPLVLYHFHEYMHNIRLTAWDLHPMVREKIYAPYIEHSEQLSQYLAERKERWQTS